MVDMRFVVATLPLFLLEMDWMLWRNCFPFLPSSCTTRYNQFQLIHNLSKKLTLATNCCGCGQKVLNEILQYGADGGSLAP